MGHAVLYADGCTINGDVYNSGTITRSVDATNYTTLNGTVTNSNNGTIADAACLTVTFDLNGGTLPEGTTTEQKVLKGQKATEPAAPIAPTGYAFGGWYKEADCNTA